MKKSINISTGVESNVVRDYLKTAHNVVARPRLRADWNYNRYASPVATNTPNEDEYGFDIEAYPIESIVEPLRPFKGSAKAKVNEAVVSAGYLRNDSPKFYISSPDDKYKYWTSPYPTNGSGNFSNHTDGITTARPRVTYNRVVQANKIILKFENTWATPANFTVMLQTTNNGSFTNIATNPTLDGAKGTVTLYYNGSAWVSTRPASMPTTPVKGIELRVASMGPGIKKNGQTMTYVTRPVGNGDTETTYSTTGNNSSLNVIAIEAHLEADLTDRLISVSDTFDMGESSDLYPIGTITSNVAEISLSNEDSIFNKETDGIYQGLIDKNVEFNLEYIYTVSGVEYIVQQFVMYASEWSVADGIADIDLEDYSKFLKEDSPNSFMIENKSSTEIIWRILDSVGFNNYEINNEDVVENTVIPVYWTDGERTVWEELDEVAKATQTAIYFDSFGKLQVRTRENAFKDETPNWNLRAVKSGNNLPDIIDWSPSYEFESNKIDVKYKSIKWKMNGRGVAALTKVWETDAETLVVRSSPLVRSIDNNSNYIFLDQKEINLWPYKSKIQIDGEVLAYEGKQYIYYTFTETVGAGGLVTYSGQVKNVVDVLTPDELKRYQRMTPRAKRHMNYFTGGLRIVERAVWNTNQANHSVDLSGWSTKYELSGSGSALYQSNVNGMRHNRIDSTMTINTPTAVANADDTFYAIRSGPGTASYDIYGTRFKFNKDDASPTKIAGIAFSLSGMSENGYYVQVTPSAKLAATDRSSGNEIRIYSKKGGTNHLLARGSATAIATDIWYDLDVYHSGSGNSQTVTAFLNGQKVASGGTNATTSQTSTARFGLFAKGQTNADFEYAYAATADRINEPVDDYGFYDLKYGGIRGGQWEKEVVWGTRTRKSRLSKKQSTKEKNKRGIHIFDEFGPYVHEVREFEVKFEPNPVRYSYLFNTNEWFSTLVEYVATPFGAKFVIANSARNHAVLHGEDNLVYAGAASGVQQACIVLGHALEVSDEETVTEKDTSAINARGEIVAELSSDWIQSKSMAQSLATWMRNHWSGNIDQVDVTIFGNPLIEIGDIVDVDYPRQNATPSTHQYFVTGTSTSFEQGVETKLTLRRRR